MSDVNPKQLTDEKLVELIILSRDKCELEILKQATQEGLERGLIKKCKCECWFIQEDFDTHVCSSKGIEK